MLNSLLIFLGAGLGGLARYWLSITIHYFSGRGYPLGTLVVNVSGCLVMGILFALLMERFDGNAGPQLRALLLIGFLGGYTTFSSFSIETINLFESGAVFSGILNIILSMTLCLLACWIGIIGGRQL